MFTVDVTRTVNRLAETGAGTRLTMLAGVRAEGRLFRLLGPLFRRHLLRVTERNFDRLQRLLGG